MLELELLWLATLSEVDCHFCYGPVMPRVLLLASAAKRPLKNDCRPPAATTCGGSLRMDSGIKKAAARTPLLHVSCTYSFEARCYEHVQNEELH